MLNYLRDKQYYIDVYDLHTIEEYVNKAKIVLDTLNFEVKQKILRKCIDKIITNQTEMTVYGYLPLESEVGLRAICRDSWSPERRPQTKLTSSHGLRPCLRGAFVRGWVNPLYLCSAEAKI